jgi:hypothetical protein
MNDILFFFILLALLTWVTVLPVLGLFYIFGGM